ACVDDGDETQSLRNRALPSLKSRSCSNVRFAEECEKASRLTSLREVAAPPCIVSKGSGFEKSVAGVVTERTRARSPGVRSPRSAGRSPARAAPASPAARSPPQTAALNVRLFLLIGARRIEKAIFFLTELFDEI